MLFRALRRGEFFHPRYKLPFLYILNTQSITGVLSAFITSLLLGQRPLMTTTPSFGPFKRHIIQIVTFRVKSPDLGGRDFDIRTYRTTFFLLPTPQQTLFVETIFAATTSSICLTIITYYTLFVSFFFPYKGLT
jgi:hypothetical protein